MGWFESLTALVARILSGPQSFTDQVPIDTGATGLRSAWRSWLEMTYTGDIAASCAGSSVDLSDLNRRVTTIFRDHFDDGELGPAARDDLALCQATLARVVPTLSGNDRQYFAMASSIARGILDADTAPLVESKVGETDAR